MVFLDPSDGVFGRFDLAALCGCRTLNVCLFVCSQEGGILGSREGLGRGEGRVIMGGRRSDLCVYIVAPLECQSSMKRL